MPAVQPPLGLPPELSRRAVLQDGVHVHSSQESALQDDRAQVGAVELARICSHRCKPEALVQPLCLSKRDTALPSTSARQCGDSQDMRLGDAVLVKNYIFSQDPTPSRPCAVDGGARC
ncbi:unnamed protein product [Symbiodinium natans]|uniref:Uncharacterized protein n=1 Tax=Symbiodinium natans TaxID=878477 RepID=A0A812TGD6_9DINO|nr:unnamed protein product [Symbiodinium natans]